MFEIFQVGPDQLSEWDLKEVQDDGRFEWLVYWYEDGGYDGSGEAVALGKDGLLYIKNLGHCSCYGPMDGWATDCDKTTAQEFFKKKESIFELEVKDEIYKKVRELIPPEAPVFGEKFNFLGE